MGLRQVAERSKLLPIRRLLFLSYGCNVVLAFGIVLAICASCIFTLRDGVLNEGREVLKNQVKDNSMFIATEAANVFEAKVYTGLHAFVLPVVYAVMDAKLKGSGYSVVPGSSYPDADVQMLKKPLTTDSRYTCTFSATAVDERTGCSDNGLQSISAQASSIFLAGFASDGSNAKDLMSTHQASVSLTSCMDDFVRDTWIQSDDWVESFIAWAKGRIYRQFPGVVGNLTNPYGFYEGERAYDPTARPWYKKAVNLPVTRMDMTVDSIGRYSMAYSEPYKDLFGKGFLLSLTVPIFHYEPPALGVAGTDLRCESVKEMISMIRIRQTGAAHLFHKSSMTVVASRSWDPATAKKTKKINSVPMNKDMTFEQASAAFKSCSSTSSEEVEGTLLVYKPILNGEFCITAATPMEEVLRPIDEQEDTINSVADSLFSSSMMICVISFAVVLLSVVWLALRMSAPLIATSLDTKQIVLNIGGNLFEGVNLDKKHGGVGEVACLRESFVDLVYELKIKRELVTIPTLNPLYEKFPAATEAVNNVQGTLKVACEQQDPTVQQATGSPTDKQHAETKLAKVAPEQQATGSPTNKQHAETKLTLFNRIKTHLVTKLILPMVAALLVIIILTSTRMSDSATEWIEPLKKEMVREELSMLDLRAYELAHLVSETMGSYADTLQMVRSYTEDILSGKMQLRDKINPSPFSPSGYCDSFSTAETPTDCQERAVEWDTRRQLKVNGDRVRLVHLDSSVWYAPVEPIEGKRRASPKEEQEGLAAHFDNVARVAFFSSEVTFVYFGFEDTEVYRQYPYMKLPDTWVNSEMKCVDTSLPDGGKRTVNQWTPHCRWWYKGAVVGQGQVVFNPVDVDSVTKMPFVSISTIMRKPGGGIYGVAAVDANIGKLELLIEKVKFYEKGFAYLYDEAGFGIIHREIKGRSGRFPIDELAAAGDNEFKKAYVAGVKTKFGQKGTWAYPWLNPETNEEEVWTYSFLPVPGVPYQLVVAVLDTEVKQKAQELEDRLQSYITVQVVTTVIVFIFSSGFLVVFSLWFNRNFANPILGLTQLIKNSKASGYEHDPDRGSREQAVSAELGAVFDNFKKVLVALRFGNPAYARGNKERELQSILAAKELVQSTGNERGIGVCLNNLGNCVAAIDEKKINANQIKATAEELLNQAVENARSLAVNGNSGVTQDTVGQRLFGLALLHLKKSRMKEATACLLEALECHKGTESWQHLAKVAYVLVGRLSTYSAAEATQLMKLISDISQAAVNILMQPRASPFPVGPKDGTALAQLYFALYKTKEDKRFVLAALARVPHIEHSVLTKIARYAKFEESNDIIEQVDAGMGQLTGIDWMTGPIISDPDDQAKGVVFLVDRTWAPILKPAVTSVRNVFEKNMNSNDYVGYYSLGDGWIFPPTLKGAAGPSLVQKIVRSEVVSGGPLLYASMTACLQQLQTVQVASKWLIVLSDTVDLEDPWDQIVLRPGMTVMAPIHQGGRFEAAVVQGVREDLVTVEWQAQQENGTLRKEAACEDKPAQPIVAQESAETDQRAHGAQGASATIRAADCQLFAPIPCDQGEASEMEKRLKKAGARTGQVTISLMWDNLTGGRSDLDLHTNTATGATINYENRESGGGYLDVDRQTNHDEPVENCFFEEIPDGNYSAFVRNYSGASPKPFTACIQAKVPITLSDTGEMFQGKKMVQGKCVGTGPGSDVPIFQFSVKKTPPPGAQAAIQGRADEVFEALRSSPSMNLVVINSSGVSGWNPTSHKWPTFRKNIQKFIGALGEKAHHFPANNAEEVAQRFEEVASLIDANLSEQL